MVCLPTSVKSAGVVTVAGLPVSPSLNALTIRQPGSTVVAMAGFGIPLAPLPEEALSVAVVPPANSAAHTCMVPVPVAVIVQLKLPLTGLLLTMPMNMATQQTGGPALVTPESLVYWFGTTALSVHVNRAVFMLALPQAYTTTKLPTVTGAGNGPVANKEADADDVTLGLPGLSCTWLHPIR